LSYFGHIKTNCPQDLKRIAAILLIGVFFFNWFGYRLLTNYLQQKADATLEAQLDRNNYDESSLVEMRVPLNMPYNVSSSDFERVNGEIEINGIHYKYVKRKVEDGQLVLMCLPNDTKMQLESAKDDFYKLVNDLQHPSQSKSPDTHTAKSPVTEYWQQQNNWNIEQFAVVTSIRLNNALALPISPVITTPAQPPEC
jgi:hypothetical protein